MLNIGENIKIRGAIFDMDGTVIDSLMFWDYLWGRVGEKYLGDPAFRPSEEVDKNVRTMIFADAMAYFHACYNPSVEVEAFIDFCANELRSFYREVATVKKGAAELLSLLKENNISVCLASASAREEVVSTLRAHGLLKYFDFVISCADIGAGKDKPDIYLEAERLMGIPRGDMCVFEDSYVALETAKNAGFHTIGIFDRYNFGQDRLKMASEIYLDESQTLGSLLDIIRV